MNPPSDTNIPAVQYTSQMVAIEDSHCQRSTCQKLIQKGEPRLYVRNHIEGNSRRYVCKACYEVYVARSKTTVRVREPMMVGRGSNGMVRCNLIFQYEHVANHNLNLASGTHWDTAAQSACDRSRINLKQCQPVTA